MDTTLDFHPDQCPRTEEAPRWSTHEVDQDVEGAMEGLHIRKQL
jgi:hypothetical protein